MLTTAVSNKESLFFTANRSTFELLDSFHFFFKEIICVIVIIQPHTCLSDYIFHRAKTKSHLELLAFCYQDRRAAACPFFKPGVFIAPKVFFFFLFNSPVRSFHLCVP